MATKNSNLIVTTFKVDKKAWHDLSVFAALKDTNRGAIIRKLIDLYLQGKVNIDDER